MDSKQLFQALVNNPQTKEYFDGVFSKDNLEDIVVKPTLIICNTDPSSKPGKHWILFYFENDVVDFFDSLGKHLSEYGKPFVKFVKRFSKQMNECKIRTQPKGTDVCGAYCLFYALCRVKHYPMGKIVHSLYQMNCVDVVKTVEDNFKFCKSVKCSLLQSCSEH